MSDRLSDPTAVIDLLGRAAESLLQAPGRRGSTVHLPRAGRLTLAGDLHDNPLHLQRILAVAGLGRGGDRHLVLQELIHGDRLVNGVDLSHRMLLRVADLVLRHPGQVHPLLANHELGQWQGHRISKGAGDNVALFDDGLDWVFGEDAPAVADAIGGFIAAMPLAVRSPSGILCSHSLPAPAAMEAFDPTVLDRALDEADLEPPHGSAYAMVWGRGHTAPQVRALLDTWGVALCCVGHGFVEQGAEAVCPGLLMLNSDHAGGAVARFDLAAEPPDAESAALSALPLSSIEGLLAEAAARRAAEDHRA